MNTSLTQHPAADTSTISLPDFLLVPAIEAAYRVITRNEEQVPSVLRRIAHFDAKAINNSTARGQIISAMNTDVQFCEHVRDEFFSRDEIQSMLRAWSYERADEIIAEMAERNDLSLLASILWLGKPEHYEFALGQIVAYSTITMNENEKRDSQRAEDTRVSHIEKSFKKEKERAELLESDVKRLEEELRDERKNRRVKEQRTQAQVDSLQKQIDEHSDVVSRAKESKERQQQRIEREASRAGELEARLRLAQDDAQAKSLKISQLQEQLASALSSDIQLTYEDLQNLIRAQQDADQISRTIVSIMNKTRSILTQSEPAPVSAPSVAPQKKRVAVAVSSGIVLDSPDGFTHVLSNEKPLVVVDGYNVSLNRYSELPLEVQRERIVAAMANLQSRFSLPATVVFDGQSATTKGRIQSHVRVLFSPGDVTADDVIVEHISTVSPDQAIVVVTDDRNLRARVRGLGCEVVSATTFVAAAH